MDPQTQDVQTYAEFAHAKGMEITHAIDTHIQADHFSGGRKLSEMTGAQYCLHTSADVSFAFTPLTDGQELDLGNVTVRVLHTPGHSPESICLLVTDNTRGPEPWFLLTGDTLFVGAVGRPDLPGNARESAAQLYELERENPRTARDSGDLPRAFLRLRLRCGDQRKADVDASL